MGKLKDYKYRYYKLRAKYRKRRRLLFPSPAEVEFVRIMGGEFFTISWIKDPITKFPLTFITSMGILKRESIEREVRAGAMYIDFATVGLVYNRGIEIDGALYHRDIVKEQNRDEYLAKKGWHVLHIPASDVYYKRDIVQQKVLRFLSAA